MKYFIISLVVLMLTLGVGSVGFAGKAKGPAPVTFSNNQQPTEDQGPITSEAVARGPRKSTNRQIMNIDPSLANPVPVREAMGFTAGLSGLYHIPGDFASIGAAAAVLNFVGTSGPTTFQLDNASYSEGTVTFGSRPGTDVVTIQPKAGTAVTVNFITAANAGKGFAFNGANHVTIDGVNAGGASLTLQYASGHPFPSSDAYAGTIYISGGSSNITVTNTTIKGNILGATWQTQTDGRPAVFIYGQTAQSVNQNISIDHCTIINATFGIKALTDAASTSGATMNHVTYAYNNVGGAYGGNVLTGALTEFVGDFHYDHNTIDGIEVADFYWNFGETEYDHLWNFAANFLFDFGQYSGGHIYSSNTGSSVSYNEVKDVHNTLDGEGGFLVYGLVVRLTGTFAVHNNRIQGISNVDNGGQMYGLRVQNVNSYHNSVRLTGALAHSNITVSCLNGTGDVKNNAFSNEVTGGAATTVTGMLSATTSDGNAVYCATGRQVSGFATPGAYLAANPTKDNHSIFGVGINFSADLHITSGPSAAENIGVSHVLLATDVDGDTRDTTDAGTRDAGADEFANTGSPIAADVYPATPLPPATSGPSGVPQIPKAVIKNNSLSATGAFNVTLTATSGPSVYTDTKSVSIGANNVATVTFANFTPLAGAYTFTVTTALGGDATPGNDVSPVR
ncbi:MAG TPA: hypothetical protein VL633_06840, partial [Bacteroidota bacterium]|nr:hypothetical protein [Bacteroidota bacterium]